MAQMPMILSRMVGSSIINRILTSLEQSIKFMQKLLLISLLVIAGLSYGKIGQALNFDGVDDYVQVNKPVYQNNTSYSISFWIKSPAQATGNIKSAYAESVTSGAAYLRLASWPGASSNQLRVVIRNDAATAVLAVYSTTIVFNDTWHHIAWTDANGTAALYIDGVRDASNFNYTRSGVFTLNTSTIGAIVDSGPDDFLQSKIDDVRVYNRAMSASEIRMLYRGNATRVGLVGYWPLIGNTSGTFEPDFSGKGNHGTRTLGPYRSAMSPYMRFRR